MGVYLSSPITEKISADEKCGKFTYGASSMQGWRMSQEDAHNCVPEFEEDTSLFAVYDGHGGAEVAQYCALHLPDYIKHTPGYKDGRLDDGLQDAFLGFDATLTEPNAIRELKTLAGVEEEAEEDKDQAGVVPASQIERDLLLAEANMPLEDVLAQYDGIHAQPQKSLGIKNAKHQFQSPMIRPKGQSRADKGGGDTWSTSTVTSEADSTKSSHEDDTRTAPCRVSLDSKLANGHADNDNNLNIEKEISQSFPSVDIIVQDEDGNEVTDCQSYSPDIPTSTTGPADCNTPILAKPSRDASSSSNLPSSTTPSEGASSAVDTGQPSSSEAGQSKAQSGLVSSNVTEESEPADHQSSSLPEANSSSSKMDLTSSIEPNSSSESRSQPFPSSGSTSQPTPSSGPIAQPDPSSGSSKQPDPTSQTISQSVPSSGSSAPSDPSAESNVQPGSSSGCIAQPDPSSGSSSQPGPSSGSITQQGPSSGSITQQEPSSGSSTQPGSSSGSSKDLQECGSSSQGPVAGSSSGLAMLVMDDDSDDDSDDYEGSSDEEESDEEDDSDDGELEEIEGALTKDPMMAKQEEEPGSDSGCTAVVAIIKGRQLVVANAGDSRCVLCRDGKAVDLSFDHKPEDFPEQQRIERAGGKVTMDGRVNGGLNLSRAIGDHCYKKNEELPAKDQMITAFPDIQSTTLGREDEFIVLACDGIWNYLNSQEVVDFVRKKLLNLEYRETPSKICEEMFTHCLAPNTMGDGTGCDNMTCIVILLDEKFRASGPFVAELEPVKRGSLKRDASQVDTTDEKNEQVEKKMKLSTEDEDKMEVTNSVIEHSEVKTEFNQLHERESIKSEENQTDSGD